VIFLAFLGTTILFTRDLASLSTTQATMMSLERLKISSRLIAASEDGPARIVVTMLHTFPLFCAAVWHVVKHHEPPSEIRGLRPTLPH